MVSSCRSAVIISAALLGCWCAALPGFASAQDSATDALRRQIVEMQEQLKKALERIDQLENERDASAAGVGEVEKSVQSIKAAPGALNPAIGMVLDANIQHK